MADEEKAEDYEINCIADVYRDDVCTIPYAYSAQKLEKAYLDGLAEGRKELEKENEDLKAEIENLKKTYKKQRNKRIDELQKENARLKAQNEKMKCCENSTTTLNGDFISCSLQEEVIARDEAIKKLEQKIDKMKCCTTCVNHTFYIPQVDRLVKGKDDTKCENCIHYSLNKLENYRKGKELVDNWELKG